MHRAVRLLFAAAVAVASIAVASPANAVDTVSFTWTVPCNDANGVGTNEYDMYFIPGAYVVTATGACTLDDNSLYGFGATTPCTALLVGAIPCAGATVSNLPGEACWTTFSAVQTHPCAPAGATVNGACSPYTIRITTTGDTCLNLAPGVAGFVAITTATPLSMRAVLVDCCHSDNTGYFVITATRV